VETLDSDPATEGQRADLYKAMRDLEPHQRKWLVVALKHSSGQGSIVPNVDGPRFNQGHVRLLRNKIEDAGRIPDPGPSSDRIAQTLEEVKAAQQEPEDEGRPF
jgi:hypothetical protein